MVNDYFVIVCYTMYMTVLNPNKTIGVLTIIVWQPVYDTVTVLFGNIYLQLLMFCFIV